MKNILILIALLIIAATSYGGYQHYQKSQEAKAVSIAIRDSTTHVARQLDFFREDRGATYMDAIREADSKALQIGAAIEQLQKLEIRRNPALVAHGEQYLKAAQESLRRAKALVHAKAEFIAARNTLSESLDSMKTFVADPTDEVNRFNADVAKYGSSAAVRRSRSANDDMDTSAAGLSKALAEMISLRTKRPPSIPEDCYLTDVQVSDIKITVH